MKFNTNMPASLRPYYRQELTYYQDLLKAAHFERAWHHLERAHVIGQAYPLSHTYVHWLMLRFGFRIKDWKEVLGQLPRLLVGGVKSFVGKIPVGNTGGANVPPLQPMPIAEDLQVILQKARVS